MTGATGYVGGRIERRFKAEGWQVVRLSRTSGPGVIPFRLGDAITPRELTGFSVLIHCAHDFAPVTWKDIHDVNVVGADRLMRSAQQAGIGELIFISSISAFSGCRSLYGQAKLEVEERVRSMGGWVVRPGLVWGESPGGLFGRFVRIVKTAPVLPVPAGGPQVQYMVHDADLAEVVWRCAGGEPRRGEPITVAHPRPWPLRDLLVEVARAQNRTRLLLPIPWRLAWLGLQLGDRLRLPLGIHSDNLVSFVYQNPSPTFDALEASGVTCREFCLEGSRESSRSKN